MEARGPYSLMRQLIPVRAHGTSGTPTLLPEAPQVVPGTVRTERSRRALRRDAVLRRSLAAADVLSAAAAVVVAVGLLGDDAVRPAALLAIPLITLTGKAAGLYDRDQHVVRKTTLEEVPALFRVATLYTLLTWLAAPVLIDGALGTKQVLGLWGLLFLGMVTGRVIARAVSREAMGPERCLVIGDPATADALRRKLAESQARDAQIVARLDLPSGEDTLWALDAADSDVLRTLLADDAIDRIVIAPGEANSEAVLDAVRLARGVGAKVSVVPRLFEAVGSTVEFDDVDGLTLLGIRPEGLSRSSQMLKRALDVVGAGAMLLLLAPLLVTIVVAIRVSSPGRVIYRQRRIGRGGEEFRMLKFRTMVDGSDEQRDDLLALNDSQGLFKLEDDPRLTRVGRLLRRSYLDELPQLVNVLRGEMSLVGPRPLVPEEDEQVEGWYRRRLHLTPGITGPWQLLGPIRVPLLEMAKIDYLYGANWSLWTDVKLMLRTAESVLRRRGV